MVVVYILLLVEDIYYVLKYDYFDFDYEYDLMLKFKEVLLFFWDKLEKGFVYIYYFVLLEWLISEFNKGNFFYVKK